MAISTGPAIRGVCRILNQNSCGSGCIVGIKDGKSLIMTNAHVAGTQIGRIVKVFVESQNVTLDARVVIAAYSDQTSSDWSLLETVNPYSAVKPVPLYKGRPTGSHYTKGFPRCQPHAGTDINIVEVSQNVIWWEPDAIGGQSGSSVWNDTIERGEMILTWQWNNHGAGQPTAAIYGEMTSLQLQGQPLPPGMIELHEYDFSGMERGYDDPIVESGIRAEMGIQDWPIWWAADGPVDPPPPPPAGDWAAALKKNVEIQIENERRAEEAHRANRMALEASVASHGSGFSPDVDTSGLFGL